MSLTTVRLTDTAVSAGVSRSATVTKRKETHHGEANWYSRQRVYTHRAEVYRHSSQRVHEQ